MKDRLKGLIGSFRALLRDSYFEIYVLYITLVLLIVSPVIIEFVRFFGRIIMRIFRFGIITDIANVFRILLRYENARLFGIVIIMGISVTEGIKRHRRGELESSMLYNVVRRPEYRKFIIDNGSVFTMAILGMGMIFYVRYSYHYRYSYYILLIVAIFELTIIGYMEQLRIISESIERTGNINISDQKLGFASGVTRDAVAKLENVDIKIKDAVESRLKSERLKTELITNISHDLKTPLTSIINYTDILKKQQLNEEISSYIEVLDRNSARLKVLITDLIEASKTETGNIILKLEELELNELIYQVYGEFDHRFEEKGMGFVFFPEKDIYVYADGSHFSRVIENVIGNAVKYAQENTRVYVLVEEEKEYTSISIKNISKDELNISPDELMERFVRGERSRHTEGSGLGLYIARNLMELMNGEFDLSIDGDLFGVSIKIPRA